MREATIGVDFYIPLLLLGVLGDVNHLAFVLQSEFFEDNRRLQAIGSPEGVVGQFIGRCHFGGQLRECSAE